MGRNISSDAIAYSTFTATEPLALGDVVMQRADGQTYPLVNPSSVFAPLRPLNKSAATLGDLFVDSGALSIPSVSPNAGAGSAVLSNGNIVLSYYSTSSTISFDIITPAGTLIASAVTVASSTSVSNVGMALAAIPSGGFVVAYFTSGSVPTFATFTNTGSAGIGATAIAAASTSPSFMDVAVLTGGNFAFLFSRTSTQLATAVFNSSGVSVRATNDVAGTSAGGIMAGGVCALTGGNFAIAYCSQTASQMRIATFTAAGAVAVAEFVLTITSAGIPTTAKIVALIGGGFAVAAGLTSSDNQCLSVFNGSAAQQGANRTFSTVGLGNRYGFALMALPSGGVAVAAPTAATNTLGITRLTSAGVLAGSVTNAYVGGGLGGGRMVVMARASSSATDSVIAAVCSATNSLYYVYSDFTAANTINGSVKSTSSVNPSGGYPASMLAFPTNTLGGTLVSECVLHYTSSSNTRTYNLIGGYSAPASAVGVAAASASASAACAVQVSGNAKVTTSGLSTTYYLDAVGKTPNGIKGALTPTSFLISTNSAPVTRSIN